MCCDVQLLTSLRQNQSRGLWALVAAWVRAGCLFQLSQLRSPLKAPPVCVSCCRTTRSLARASACLLPRRPWPSSTSCSSAAACYSRSG